jgi:hypothetical protein
VKYENIFQLDDDRIHLDHNDLLRTLEFVNAAIENFNENVEVHQQLNEFLWKLVDQSEFIGFYTATRRIMFHSQLRDMVRACEETSQIQIAHDSFSHSLNANALKLLRICSTSWSTWRNSFG